MTLAMDGDEWGGGDDNHVPDNPWTTTGETYSNVEQAPLLGTQGPPPELRLSLDDLAADARTGRLVFRVYTPGSASPLVWTGEVGTSGFASLNRYLGDLTPEAYTAGLCGDPGGDANGDGGGDTNAAGNGGKGSTMARRSLGTAPHEAPGRAPWPNWTTSPFVRQTIVDHTTKRCRATWDVPWEGYEVGPDSLSPWISASRDPGWAVWEAARRLAVEGEAVVNVAVIAMGAEAGSGSRHRAGASARRADPTFTGATGELALDPLPPLRDMARSGRGSGARQRMTNREKEGLDIATYAAGVSSEILFFGRVFATSIVANLEFTPDECPLDLPAAWFVTQSSGTDGRGGWLSRLVWDPAALEADWGEAKRRIGARQRELAASALARHESPDPNAMVLDTDLPPRPYCPAPGDHRTEPNRPFVGPERGADTYAATNARAGATGGVASDQSRRIAAGQRDNGWATFHARGGTAPLEAFSLPPPPRRQRAATAQR